MRKFVFQFPILPEKSDFLPIQPTVDSGKMPKCKKKESTLTGTLFCWLGWKDLNPRNDGARTRCLTPWLHPSIQNKKKTTEIRISTGSPVGNPGYTVGWDGRIWTLGMTGPEPAALPLGYIPICWNNRYRLFRPLSSGWARWIRTIGMKESKSSALPLGYSPM